MDDPKSANMETMEDNPVGFGVSEPHGPANMTCSLVVRRAGFAQMSIDNRSKLNVSGFSVNLTSANDEAGSTENRESSSFPKCLLLDGSGAEVFLQTKQTPTVL